MALPEVSVRRPITVLMAVVAVAVFGSLAFKRLPVELLPDLSYPTLTIQTVYEDAAPVSVEQFVTRPVEEAVGVIPGVRDMRSTSRPGLSEVVLEFEWDEQMDFAALDVREKLGLVNLPQEAEVPRVLRFDPSLDPVVRLALSGDRPLDELRQLAERWLKPRLEAIEGVAAARVRGGLDPEIVVEADEDRLASFGLSLQDLATALQAENVNQPGGTLKDFNAVYLVRTLHEFDDLDQLRRTVVRDSIGGRVRVEDVASVRRGHRDRDEITRSGGREVVELALHREGSFNTISVAQNIRTELTKLREKLSGDLEVEVLTDQSRYIAEAVGQVRSAALVGGILAIVVLYFFLRDLMSTVIIGLSIPTSVVATFLLMQQAGVSLNIMSLGGLALGVGMLVDSSIVVLEAVDRRRAEGHPRAEAAILGANDVSGAVIASTLTTISVFFPIVFVEGIAGQLFYDQAVTVCFSLLASLAVSLTLIPAAAAVEFGGWGAGRVTLFPWDGTGNAEADRALYRPLARFILRGPVRNPGWGGMVVNWLPALPLRLLALVIFMPAALLQFVADLLYPWVGSLRIGPVKMGPVGNGEHWFSRMLSVWLLPLRLAVLLLMGLLGALWAVLHRVFAVVMWPVAMIFEGLGRIYPPGLRTAIRWRWGVAVAAFTLFGLSLWAAPLLGTQLVPDLSQGEFAFQLRMAEGTPLETTGNITGSIEDSLVGDAAFARVFSLVGSLPSTASGRRTLGENLSQINFVLADGLGKGDEARAVERARAVFARFPGVEAELVRPAVITMKPSVVVQIFAEDLEALDDSARRVEKTLAGVAGVVDVASTLEPGNPEIRVVMDRERAAALGVSPALIGQAMRSKIRGDLIGEFREGEERLDIRLRAAESSRERAGDVARLRIRLPDGSTTPVSAIADVIVDRGPAAIQRSGGARVAEVTAKVTSGDLGNTLAVVRDALQATPLPPGVTAGMAGQDREIEESFGSLKLMMALAIFLVYVVMAAQFESLLHPFVILISVPLGLVGVVAALLLTRNPVSVLVLIGGVMLAGIVVNNAIVLVDAINRRRREGEPVDEAIVAAGAERLRPILMTTTTTVLALLPMALGLGAGDELRAPLAVTVIGGLLVATLLTLVVIPCMYRIFSRSRQQPGTADDTSPADLRGLEGAR